MAPPQRPGEITYYDELGLESTASPDEVRDAFRALARLLHPDAQTDPQLKEIAERQMRKLNRTYAVLSDAARRTAYDDSLNAPRTAPIIVFSGSDGNLRKLIVRVGTLAALIFGTFLLIWFMVTSNSAEVRGQEARVLSAGKASETGDGESGDQISRLRDELRVVETERDSALEQLGRLAGKQTSQPAAARFRDVRMAEKTVADSMATAETPQATPSAAPAGAENASGAAMFSGVWVYSKSPGFASPGGRSQYPPEFIEMTVTEKNGALHGQYHSRYQVLDHAIFPDVDFVFSGTPSGSALNCAWQGPGGAKGHVTLKLTPASTVAIDWNATELGSQQWLVNGSATLSKK
jgi:curved DNA-binding protein CbpA